MVGGEAEEGCQWMFLFLGFTLFISQEFPFCSFLLTDTPASSIMASDLESSLTSIDWLPQLTLRATIEKLGGSSQAGPPGAARKCPPGSPTDPNATLSKDEAAVHQDGKPRYSYATLITYAINSSPAKKMTLSEIYRWICDNFPYYKNAGIGWKVRTCIVKVPFLSNNKTYFINSVQNILTEQNKKTDVKLS